MNIDFAEIKPSFWNFILFALYSLAVIPVVKFFFAKVQIPGFSALAGSI